MSALHVVRMAEDPPRPADLIRVIVPRLNKLDWISEYLKQIDARDYDLNWARVTETRVLAPAEWNELMHGLLEDRDWLAGKGGTGTWADVPDVEYFKLTEAQQTAWKRCAFLYVIAVQCAGETIYIDPEGYNYARYVAFRADGLPEGKTRAEIRREEEKAAADAKQARHEDRVRNPAPVPADHGLKFYWNGIRANGGQLEKCQYSAGALLGNYPEGTISVYARDYHRFSDAVKRVFHVTNDSDHYSDYYADDTIRLAPHHPLYAAVKAAHAAQETYYARVQAKRKAKYGY